MVIVFKSVQIFLRFFLCHVHPTLCLYPCNEQLILVRLWNFRKSLFKIYTSLVRITIAFSWSPLHICGNISLKISHNGKVLKRDSEEIKTHNFHSKFISQKFQSCSFLKIYCDSTGLGYVFVSPQTYWQTSIYLSNHTLYIQNSLLQAVSLFHWIYQQAEMFLLSGE
jgi:hypothetical protein